jgi:predicted transposase YdaD
MSRIESFDEGVDEGLKRGREEGRQEGREEGIHLYVPIIKELLNGELSNEQIADKFSVSVQLVDKLAEELN